MPVYVDPLTNWGGSETFRWKDSCHMYADTLEELHAMAAKLGMRRSWFQDKPAFPHYDLVASKRRLSVELGAFEHSRDEMVAFMRAQRSLAAPKADRGKDDRDDDDD